MPRTPLGSTHYLLAALPSRVTRETCTMAVRRRVLLALLIALGAALSLARVIATAPLLIALGATLPPVAVAAVLIFPGRRDPARFTAHLAAFMWGALGAAFLASAMNDALSVWVDAVAGEEGARAFVPALGGPIVEEVTKAAGLVAILLLAPGALAGLVDGIVCGALVGLGFTMTENIRYLTLAALQGGSAGLDRALWVRVALGGFTHAVFTATAGAGLGWTRERPRPPARSLWVPAAVLAAAILPARALEHRHLPHDRPDALQSHPSRKALRRCAGAGGAHRDDPPRHGSRPRAGRSRARGRRRVGSPSPKINGGRVVPEIDPCDARSSKGGPRHDVACHMVDPHRVRRRPARPCSPARSRPHGAARHLGARDRGLLRRRIDRTSHQSAASGHDLSRRRLLPVDRGRDRAAVRLPAHAVNRPGSGGATSAARWGGAPHATRRVRRGGHTRL